jgi:hypothetical protein
MRVDRADNKTAAMVKHHDKASRAIGPRIIEPRGDWAGGAGDFQIPDHSQGARFSISHMAHGHHHRARISKGDFMHLGPILGV